MHQNFPDKREYSFEKENEQSNTEFEFDHDFFHMGFLVLLFSKPTQKMISFLSSFVWGVSHSLSRPYHNNIHRFFLYFLSLFIEDSLSFDLYIWKNRLRLHFLWFFLQKPTIFLCLGSKQINSKPPQYKKHILKNILVKFFSRTCFEIQTKSSKKKQINFKS